MTHRDLLAELEVTMVPSRQQPPEAGLYVAASDQPGESRRGTMRRFWCALREQEVEVEFQTRATLGFPRIVGVRRCSAFEDPARVECGRHCLQVRFRRQWPYALPVADHRRAPAG